MSKHIAITGTKGKTTTMYILDYVIREFNNNTYKVSSTEGIFYNDELLEKVNANNYFKYFNNNCDYYLTEATSKMLDSNYYESRLVDVGIYTGIENNEHIDIHNGFDGYLTAKKKLFNLIKEDGFVVVNGDDKYIYEVMDNYSGKVIYVHYSNDIPLESDVFNFTDISISKDIMLFNINTKDFSITIKTKLLGKYNALNLTMAFATLHKLGFNKILLAMCIQEFSGIKGRFERIKLIDERIVIIDYAHTENSLKFVLENIRNIYGDNKLITVFGCGGDRTKDKRGLMGKIATELSDYVILTDDNPRNENPDDIIENIKTGIIKSNYEIIHDRKDAIEHAIIKFREPGTIILVAGKGSETDNIFNTLEFELSDYERITQILSKYNIYEI